MKIVVFQGDENRAKIETEFSKDMYFADVYADAQKLVNEIVSEVKRQKKRQDKEECSNSLFQRTPNNIIAFCAQRGQGKTTAMKSFARSLVEGQVDAEDERYKYVVLDSIDPSALDGGESIVRVVLSRLFYKMEEKEKNDEDSQRKRLILDLFQKCYSSIDYINGVGRRNQIEDDLEELATIGSSSRLKKNLKDLIDLFLEICLAKKGKYEENGFLVIPIDDVDTCVADIYRCCEEIRNYLILPNVIILMAADHTQLSHVMYQRYLQNNKELLQYETENAKEECSRLASGYLLKLIPVNHMIELPELDKMTEQEWNSLQLEYYADIDDKPQNILDSTVVDANIRRQLGKLIYHQTGIVIHKDDDATYDCLPGTMRELTQFLKKFAQRPAVDWNILYGADFEKAKAEAVKLKNNIREFKTYFLESWAMNHLSHEEYTNFKKNADRIENRKKIGKIGWTYKELLIYLVTGEGKGADNGKFKGTVVADNVFCMFITIFLNEWFAEALQDSLEKEENSKQYQKIANFMGMNARLEELTPPDKKSDRYMLYAFSIPENLWPPILEQKEMYFFYKVGEQVIFDAFNPWDYIIRKGVFYYAHITVKTEDSEFGQKETKTIEINNENRDTWMVVQSMLSNVSICVEVLKEFLKSGQNVFQKLKKETWVGQISKNYSALVSWGRGLEYLGVEQKEMEILKDRLWEELDGASVVFLFNEYNMQLFYDKYQENYKWLFDANTSLDIKNIDKIVSLIMKPELALIPEDIYGKKDSVDKTEVEKNAELKKIWESVETLVNLKKEINDIKPRKDKDTNLSNEILKILKKYQALNNAEPSTEKDKKSTENK